MSVVGIDIGGANLKASDGMRSLSRSFPLWRSPELLSEELSRLLSEFHPYGPIVVTMTGELVDCYRTRAEGVSHLVESVQSIANCRQLYFWQTGGEFLQAEEALEFPELVAAANWHALATWTGRACPADLALLIDIGSTTTDLIPIDCAIPAPQGATDLDRLCSGELVYTGFRRTPLMAITERVQVRGAVCPVAAERFATTLDLAILLRDLPEESVNLETANGRPATIPEALTRVARMLCSDTDQLEEGELLQVAKQFQEAQLDHLTTAMNQVLRRQNRAPQMVILSGEGEALAKKLILQRFPNLSQVDRLSLNDLLGPEHSQAACAYAMAKLGKERL